MCRSRSSGARRSIKYAILGGAILYFIVTRDRLIYRYIEPFWMFSLHGSVVMWIGLAVLLVATVFVRNLYCRFLCPVGAALGLLSNLTVFRIKRWSECNTCKICEKTCEWGAIRGAEDHQERVRALRRLRAALHGPEEVPALDHHQAAQRLHGASVGGANSVSRLRQAGRDQHFVLRADDHALHVRQCVRSAPCPRRDRG